MADVVSILTVRTGGVVGGATVNAFDALNVLVASGTTASDGTLTFDLLSAATFTLDATFVDGAGTWRGSSMVTTIDNVIVPVTITLTLS